MAENNFPVSPEAHSRNVTELQQYLREIHQSGANVRAVIPDGIYGQQTRDAVTDFQRSKNIPPTGEVNFRTWEAIYSAYRDAKGNLNMQEGIMPFPSLVTVISKGDSGAVVIFLQTMLNTIAGMHNNITSNSLSGVYDEDTALAVTELQAASGIPPTGQTDINTWNTIVRIFNTASDYESM